jgi:hypothetical protein
MILARALFGAFGLRLQSRDLGLLPATHFSPFGVAFGQRHSQYTCASTCSLALSRSCRINRRSVRSSLRVEPGSSGPMIRFVAGRTHVAPVARLRSYHQTPLMRFLSLQRSLAALRCAGLPAPDDPASALFALSLVVRPRFCGRRRPCGFTLCERGAVGLDAGLGCGCAFAVRAYSAVRDTPHVSHMPRRLNEATISSIVCAGDPGVTARRVHWRSSHQALPHRVCRSS